MSSTPVSGNDHDPSLCCLLFRAGCTCTDFYAELVHGYQYTPREVTLTHMLTHVLEITAHGTGFISKLFPWESLWSCCSQCTELQPDISAAIKSVCSWSGEVWAQRQKCFASGRCAPKVCSDSRTVDGTKDEEQNFRLLSNPQIIAFGSGFCGALSHWHSYLYNHIESEMPVALEEAKWGMCFANPEKYQEWKLSLSMTKIWLLSFGWSGFLPVSVSPIACTVFWPDKTTNCASHWHEVQPEH